MERVRYIPIYEDTEAPRSEITHSGYSATAIWPHFSWLQRLSLFSPSHADSEQYICDTFHNRQYTFTWLTLHTNSLLSPCAPSTGLLLLLWTELSFPFSRWWYWGLVTCVYFASEWQSGAADFNSSFIFIPFVSITSWICYKRDCPIWRRPLVLYFFPRSLGHSMPWR